MRLPRSSVCFLLALAPAMSGSALAAETPPHHELEHTSWQFLAAETGGAVATFVVFALATGEPAEACRWCETNGFDDQIRTAVRAPSPRPWATLSHGMSLGAVPILSILGNGIPALKDHELGRAGADLWILANTFVVTTGITDGVKRAVGRQRPAFHYGRQGETEAWNLPVEENLSFFSGDASWAFSLAACGTTLAYLHGYETAPWLLGGGAALATSAGVLRIVADMHWATDVLTGALVGTAVGVSLPLVLHRRKASTVAALRVVPMGRGVSISGAF